MTEFPYKPVTICSSSKFYGHAKHVQASLENHGIACHTPDFDYNECITTVDFDRKHSLTLDFLQKIDQCSTIYIIADKGYVGASVTLEVGYAHAKQKTIVSTEVIQEPAVRGLVHMVLPEDDFLRYLKSQEFFLET